MNKTKAIQNVSMKLILSIIPMLPIVLISILIINDLINSITYFLSSNNQYGLTIFDYISPHIINLAQLLLPFIIGTSITIIGIYKKRIIIGILFGMISIIAIYSIIELLMEQGMGECVKTLPPCGDLYFITQGINLFYCFTNLIAILGLAVYIIEKKHIYSRNNYLKLTETTDNEKIHPK